MGTQRSSLARTLRTHPFACPTRPPACRLHASAPSLNYHAVLHIVSAVSAARAQFAPRTRGSCRCGCRCGCRFRRVRAPLCTHPGAVEGLSPIYFAALQCIPSANMARLACILGLALVFGVAAASNEREAHMKELMAAKVAYIRALWAGELKARPLRLARAHLDSFHRRPIPSRPLPSGRPSMARATPTTCWCGAGSQGRSAPRTANSAGLSHSDAHTCEAPHIDGPGGMRHAAAHRTA